MFSMKRWNPEKLFQDFSDSSFDFQGLEEEF